MTAEAQRYTSWLLDTVLHAMLENIFKAVPGVLPGEAYRAAKKLMRDEGLLGRHDPVYLTNHAKIWARVATRHAASLEGLKHYANS